MILFTLMRWRHNVIQQASALPEEFYLKSLRFYALEAPPPMTPICSRVLISGAESPPDHNNKSRPLQRVSVRDAASTHRSDQSRHSDTAIEDEELWINMAMLQKGEILFNLFIWLNEQIWTKCSYWYVGLSTTLRDSEGKKKDIGHMLEVNSLPACVTRGEMKISVEYIESVHVL